MTPDPIRAQLRELQQQAREDFDSLFTKNGKIHESVSVTTLHDNNDTLIASAYHAGQERAVKYIKENMFEPADSYSSLEGGGMVSKEILEDARNAE